MRQCKCTVVVLTILRFREDISTSLSTRPAQSIVGTASFVNHLLDLKLETFSVSTKFKSGLSWKPDGWKCAEQSTDVVEGCQFDLCRRTNRVHWSLRALIFGKVCIEMPSVFELLLQLTFWGPPATQHLPETLFFVCVCVPGSHSIVHAKSAELLIHSASETIRKKKRMTM